MSLLTELQESLRYDEALNCMRCGFCLSACPTYKLSGQEPNSPRGRIALARAVAEGKLSLDDILNPLDQCTGCRACEPACPAGVHYGVILEAARATVEKARPHSLKERLIRKVGLGWILGTPAGINLAGWGLWFYQAAGLKKLAHGLGLVKAIAGHATAELDRAMLDIPSPLKRSRGGGSGTVFPAHGSRRARVGYFTGCIMEIAFWQENRDAIALLQAAGCEVVIFPGQGCCGAVHAHAGEEEMSHQQAKRNILADQAAQADYIVNAAGGCGAALKEYKLWFARDPEWAERAERFSARIKDISEILAEMGPLPLGERAGCITYQDSCHLRNVQKVINQPRHLLKQIPGAQFVELTGADTCCGAGGIYNVTQPVTAGKIGDDKAQKVKGTAAQTLVVANPPCHLHLRASIRRNGLEGEVEVLHIASLLRQSLDAGTEAKKL